MSEPPSRVEPLMRLTLKCGGNLWELLSKSGYTSLQTILEIMDNAISSKIGATKVNFQVDFDRGIAYIEDNGVGFPIILDLLRRALEHGSRNPSDLNEHGSGLKAALAAMDPSNSRWRIVFKRDGIIREIRAPYGDELDVHQISDWPGTMNDQDHGAYIEFPIDKKRFAELYASKKAKCDNPLPYIKQELSQVWMLHERVKSGAVQLHLNGEPIEPLRINSFADYEANSRRVTATMTTGGRVDIYQFMLNKHVPDSWFKRTSSATGYYFFKNGRFIECIDNGAPYRQLYGAEKHQSHIGFIAIINVTGTQDKLPHTTPTKIQFPESALRSELYEIVKANIKIDVPIEESEESLVRQFIQMRKNNFADIPGFSIKEKEQVRFTLDGHDECASPQLDIVEYRQDKIFVYEAKKDTVITLPALRQLYGNWKIACAAFSGRPVVPVLMINVDSIQSPKWLAPHLVIWDNMPLIVMNYAGRTLL
jgi:hypothetical protein